MSSFFEVINIDEVEFTNIEEKNMGPNTGSLTDFIVLVGPPNNELTVWMEFAEAIGITVFFAVNGNEKHIEASVRSHRRSKTIPFIDNTIIPIFKIISDIYAKRLTQIIFHQAISPNFKININVPIISRSKFNSFIMESTPNTDEIIAAFIQDIIVEVPEIVEKLSFSERRTLEREMKVLARTNEQKAIGRLREAKQTAREADAIEEDAHRKTDAALGAEAAAEGLERLTKHWHDKIQHHQLRRASNFMWFAVTLVAALFLFGLNQTGILQAIVLQLCNNDSLCPTPWQNFWQDAYLTAKGNTSWLWAILSLKGILLPVLGVAWLLRIFSRQNASHFALENDARQRLALLVSYVRLQENPDTKLTEEERILFLRTLFRTAEVSSKEDAQPNVVELIGKLKP